MSSRLLLVRADAGPAIGAGHVLRCLALAQAWRRLGGTAAFAQAGRVPRLAARLASAGVRVVPLDAEPGSAADLAATRDLAHRLGAATLVLDGYGFEADYQRALRTAVRQLVVLDEAGRACDAADLVVNQNLHATAALYPWAAAAPERLALGPSFALLRREFEAWRRWRRPQVTVPRRVLVTMGGADPANATARVLAVLGRVARDLEVRVVVGPANPRPAALAAALERAGLRGALTTVTTEMPALMAWADLAVSAAGSTVWELAFMGLPSVVVPIADNQRPIAAAAEAAGVALAADPAAAAHSEALAGAVLRLRDDAGCRRELSARGRRLVDGGGAGRVASRLTAGRLAAR